MAKVNEVSAKKKWVRPVLDTLNIEQTLIGSIPGRPEGQEAGNSGNFGSGQNAS